MNRVVITGYGVASPIGNDAQTFLDSLKEGKNGIGESPNLVAAKLGFKLPREVKTFPFVNNSTKKAPKRRIKFPYLEIIQV